jgi:hypothetical protein
MPSWLSKPHGPSPWPPDYTGADDWLRPFPTPNLQAFFPPGTPPEKIAEVTQWLNFYDPDDILGYPMKSLDPKYAKTVTRDIAVNVGNLLRSWNPASHTEYWTDNNITRPVAELLHGILRLL